MKYLDLDNPSSYENIFDHIICKDDVVLKLVDDYYNSHEIYDQLSCNPHDLSDPFVSNLQDQFIRILCDEYSHIIAYHSCRTKDPNQFIEKGLISASKEFLHDLSKQVFDVDKGLETAMALADECYNTYFESISMYVSAKFASAEYLVKGSHYLRMVAANLRGGEERLKQDHAQRIPVFVKCKMPVFWLNDTEYIKSYVTPYVLYTGALARRYIYSKSSDYLEYGETYQSIGVYKSIQPENVESILTADVCLDWKKSKQV